MQQQKSCRILLNLNTKIRIIKKSWFFSLNEIRKNKNIIILAILQLIYVYDKLWCTYSYLTIDGYFYLDDLWLDDLLVTASKTKVIFNRK